MSDINIQFNRDTAEEVRQLFTHAADTASEQVPQRRTTSEAMLQDFKGPYARTYEANVEVIRQDLSNFSAAFEQIASMLGMAIDAYDQQMRDIANKGFWEMSAEEKWEFVKDLFGDTGAPPAPAILSSAQPPSTSPKNTEPTAAHVTDVVSAIPQAIKDGVSQHERYDETLSELVTSLRGGLERFSRECAWVSISDSGVIDALVRWLEDNTNEYAWLRRIAEKLEAISGDPNQVSALPYAALEAAIGPATTRTPLAIDSPTIQGTEASAGYIGDPVNAATGNFIEPETDLTYTESASTLTFTRMYNALNPTPGVFGVGWSSPLDSRLILTDENATWVKDDGQHLVFPRAGAGWDRAHLHPLWLTTEIPSNLPIALPQEHSHHTRLLTIRDNTGALWVFSPTGAYLAHAATTGDAVTMLYSPQGLISRITHTRGRYFDIEYAGGHVAYIQGHEGSRVEYSYDDSGKLTGARTAAGTRHYTYNPQGLISAVTAADGTVEVENLYDNQNRVRSQHYPHGLTRNYSYLSSGVTLVTNQDGSHANTWISDHHGRLVGMIDAHQNRQTMAYDTFNNRVSITERDGATTTRLFNHRGLLTREVTPEGADITCEYDQHDRLTTLITANGSVISYQYADTTGAERNPSVLVDALGGHTQLTWDEGLLMSMTGPTGVSVSCAYNAFGELISITNAAGDTTQCERDASGRIIALITPLGLTTRFTYDAAGNLLSRTEPDGSTWNFTYLTGGRLHTVTDPTGASTTYEYNTAGDIAQIVDPLGRVTAHGFDTMGNLTSLTDPAGATWSLVYDQLMQNTALIDPLGNTWRREFTVNGDLAAVIDPTGQRTTARTKRHSGIQEITDAFGTHTTTFDAYGRPVKQTSADGSEEMYTYDAAGHVVEILDGEGHLTALTRDARGEITSIISPEGRATTFTYDECGRPSTMTDPTGVVTALEYDADSRVIARTSSAGAREEITYDRASRVVAQRTNTGLARYGYDACGRLIFAFDQQFGTRRFAYDAAGQLVCATNGLGGKTRYTYTLTGQVARMTAPNGAVTSYEYDAAGQLLATVDALGRRSTASYDAAGRVLARTSPDGDQLTYTYDQGLLATLRFNQQLLARIERDAPSRRTQIFDYTCTGTSLVDEHTGTPVVHTLINDRLGRLVEHSTAGGHAGEGRRVRVSYAADGNRSAVDVDGAVTEYSYDQGTGLLTSLMRGVAIPGGEGEQGSLAYEALTYHYDQKACLRQITDSTGALVRSFDTVPTVARVEEGTGQAAVGATTAAGSANGAETAADQASYRADGGWATIEHRVGGSGEKMTTTTYYNAEGLVVGVDDAADGLRLFTYDGAHQLVAVTTAEGVHTFTYDEAGFLVGECTAAGVEREYSYDAAGQLVRLVDSEAGVSEFVYDGLGRRVQHTSGDGVTRNYAYSPVGLLAEITTTTGEGAAGASAGGVSSTVRLWNDALGLVAAVASTEGVSADGLDSSTACPLVWDPVAHLPTLMQMGSTALSLKTVASLDLVGARGVDPFGLSPVVQAPAASSDTLNLPSSATGLTAAGSLQIAGLEILGVRVYDPATRGFLTPDPLTSPTGAGWATNVYAFMGNDPAGLVDPWGLSPMTAAEFRQYHQEQTRNRSWTRLYNEAEQFLNDHAWLVTAVTVVAAVGLLASGPLGWVGMATVAGLLSFGTSVAGQKIFSGHVSLKTSLIDGAVGFAAGGLGRLASMGFSAFGSSKAGTAMLNSGTATKVGAAFSSARSGLSGTWGSVRSAIAPVASRATSALAPITSRVSSLTAPLAARFQPALGTMGQWGQNIAGQYTGRGALDQAVEGSVAGAVNNAGGYWLNAENGYRPTLEGGVHAAGVGFGLGALAPGVSGGTTQSLGITSGGWKIFSDRVSDFGLGGTNYLLSPSNDNEDKDLKGFVQEGFRNSLAGAASSSGKWAADTSDAAIHQAIPHHMQGVEVSRRDLLSGNTPAAPVSGGDAQGYDQRRY